MTNNKNISAKAVESSIKKAAIHGIAVPLALLVILSVAIDGVAAFYGVVLWIALLAIGYKTSQSKQLTAYFFFWIVKGELFIGGVYALFVTAMYFIARFA